MRYWLSLGDGKPWGPFEVAQLEQMAAEGRLNAHSQLCAVGGTSWVPASAVLRIAGIATPQGPSAGVGPVAQWTPVSLTGPILATLCCCVIGGVVSLVYASNANSKGASGDIEGAQRDASSSRSWMIASIVVGLTTNLLFVLLQVLAKGRF